MRSRALLLVGAAAAIVAGACRATFDIGLPVIEAPSRLSAQATWGEVRVRWDPVVGVTGPYQLDWAVGAAAATRVAVDGTSHLLVLVLDSEISLSVAGVDGNGVGPFSARILARPLVGTPFGNAPDSFVEDSLLYSWGSVVATGDLDADGLDDLAVGAPFSGTNDGTVSLFYGTTAGLPAGLVTGPAMALGTPESNFGYSIATGEFDGDAGDELIISARRFDDGGGINTNKGFIQVYSGDTDSPFSKVGNPVVGSTSGGMGLALAVGPLRAGGHDEIVGCAPFGSNPTVVFYEGVPSSATQIGVGLNGSLKSLCTAVGLPGDVNGDGFPDAVLGAPTTGQASIEVSTGPNFGTSSIYFTSPVANDSLGNGSIVPAGDVNGDRFADVVVSAPSSTGDGYAVLLLGTNGAFTESWRTTASASGTRFGYGMATADLNGDGWLELVIGEPSYLGSTPDRGPGRLQLFRGVDGGFETTPWWTAVGQNDERWGASIAFGDFDGNGYPDLVAGSPGEDGSPKRALLWAVAPGESPWVDAGSALTTDANATFVLAADFMDPALRETHTCSWDWDGDGTFDQTIPACDSPAVAHVYPERGVYHPRLRVTGTDATRYGESVTTVIAR